MKLRAERRHRFSCLALMAWDEKNRDEWAKRYLEQLGRPLL